MGYGSDVTIICGKKACEMLRKVCEEHQFLPEIWQDGKFHILQWECVKWYEGDKLFPEVQAVEDILAKLDKISVEDEDCAYKQFIIGENQDDIQSHGNNAGWGLLGDYYMARRVVRWDSGMQHEIELRKGEKEEMKDVKVQYLDDTIERLCYVEGKSDWVDLHAAEDITLAAGEFKLIPLGVAMQLPEGYEAHIVPRSSTYKNFGIIQTNHMGIVDNSYCGPNDWWYMPAYALRDTVIHKNDRICQFRIMENQSRLVFTETVQLEGKDRGGIGSTGVK